MPVGLYIHVPFCRTRCHFCNFYLQPHRDDKARNFVDSLIREIHLHADRNSLGGRALDTLYFGGGTPSTLTQEQLGHIVEAVRRDFGLQPDAEMSLEAHPDTVTQDRLQALAEIGFNRISFGMQSADNGELLQIGRPTTASLTRLAVAQARAAGFANIGLDVIYGLPGQDLDSWLATLDEALALAPTHLSCYALTVEARTRLAIDLRRGDRPEPDAALQNDMEDAAALRLAEAGWHRYEISNYCRPGYACRHNLLYWSGHDYLGLGPSAQSYLDGCRFGNVEDLAAYREALAEDRLPIVEVERLSREQRRREAVIFGLRLAEGVDDRLTNTGEPGCDWEKRVAKLSQQGLLASHGGRITLTDLGRRYADSVAVELL